MHDAPLAERRISQNRTRAARYDRDVARNRRGRAQLYVPRRISRSRVHKAITGICVHRNVNVSRLHNPDPSASNANGGRAPRVLARVRAERRWSSTSPVLRYSLPVRTRNTFDIALPSSVFPSVPRVIKRKHRTSSRLDLVPILKHGPSLSPSRSTSCLPFFFYFFSTNPRRYRPLEN